MGITQVTLGEKAAYHRHHLRFLAIKLTISTTNEIKIPDGR